MSIRNTFYRYSWFTACTAAAWLATVPDALMAQKGTGSRGANFARSMMRSAGGGGGGGRSGGAVSRGGPSMSRGRSGGNAYSRGGPSVYRGGGNRGGNYRGGNYVRRGRSNVGVGIGVAGSAIGLYYGSGRFGGLGYPGYGFGGYPYGGIGYGGIGYGGPGYGVPYYGVYPGYARYGYSYRANPAYGYVRPANPSYAPPVYSTPQYVDPQATSSSQVVTSRVQPTGGGAIIPASAAAAPFQAQAERAFRENRIQDAMRQSSHAVVEDQQNGRLHLFASQALFAAGRYREAAEAARVGTSMLPRDDWGYVVQNYKQFYQGTNYVNQMSRLVKFIEQNPGNAYAHALRGYHYKYLGYEEAADEQLTKAIDLDQKDPLATMLVGVSSNSDDSPNSDDSVIPGPPVEEVLPQAEVTSTSDAEVQPSDAAATTEVTDPSQGDVSTEPVNNATEAAEQELQSVIQDALPINPPSQNPPPIPTPDGQ